MELSESSETRDPLRLTLWPPVNERPDMGNSVEQSMNLPLNTSASLFPKKLKAHVMEVSLPETETFTLCLNLHARLFQ